MHHNNKRRPGKFQDNRFKNNANSNRQPEKKSVLKSWWDKLTK